MLLGELFTSLSYGELSNLSMGNDGTGLIASKDRNKLTHYTNQVLVELYTRFTHKVNYVEFTLQADKTEYALQAEYGVENLGKILSVLLIDPVTSEETDLLINDEDATCSVRTLTYDTIHIKDPLDGATMVLECQMLHTPLSIPCNLSEQITLVPILNAALECKVASKVYYSIGGEDALLKAQGLEAQYERICQMVESKDILQNTRTNAATNFTAAGFR